MGDSGFITEVFRSIQGEGPYVGVFQIFVRFCGCTRSCRYCDSVASKVHAPDCTFIGPSGAKRLRNPVDVATVAGWVDSLHAASRGVHSLSVTGGEPLEQHGFLSELLRAVRPGGIPVYLETNGLEEEGAAAVAPLVDIVSFDIKLPSLCGGEDTLGVHERVLPLFTGRELFCKIVVAEGFTIDEYTAAVRMISRIDENLPLVIQPARPVAGCASISGAALIDLHVQASRYLRRVRTIPQCHHLLDLP